jgi:hypothetical protein
MEKPGCSGDSGTKDLITKFFFFRQSGAKLKKKFHIETQSETETRLTLPAAYNAASGMFI